MVDLRASNAKLRDRATRLVGNARRVSYARAKTELEKMHWNVRDCLCDDSES